VFHCCSHPSSTFPLFEIRGKDDGRPTAIWRCCCLGPYLGYSKHFHSLVFALRDFMKCVGSSLEEGEFPPPSGPRRPGITTVSEPKLVVTEESLTSPQSPPLCPASTPRPRISRGQFSCGVARICLDRRNILPAPSPHSAPNLFPSLAGSGLSISLAHRKSRPLKLRTDCLASIDGPT
jgi:hypothetical protein